MYTVVGHPRTRARRLIWTLEELGQEYAIRPALPQSEEVRALTPLGKVPILLDGEDAVIDSVAACAYLADKHGALTYPAGTIKRARMDSMIQFTVDEIEGSLWTAAKHSFALPEDWRIKDVKETARKEFALAMKRLERRLDDAEWAGGPDFTIADIILGHCGPWAERAGFEIPEGPVGAYFARVRARPALARAAKRMEEAAA